MQIADPSIRCKKCGYSLMHQSDPGTCPDCGNPFSTRSGKGFTQIRETHRNISGTGLLVAMLTGALSLLMVPVCLMIWFIHFEKLQYDPGRPSPWLLTLFTITLVLTCLSCAVHFLYNWLKIRRELKAVEE